MPAGVGAVCDDSVDKLGNTVNNADERQDDTETGILDPIFRPEGRHRKRKILTDKIKNRISDHGGDNHPPLPVLKAFFCLHSFVSRKYQQI